MGEGLEGDGEGGDQVPICTTVAKSLKQAM